MNILIRTLWGALGVFLAANMYTMSFIMLICIILIESEGM